MAASRPQSDSLEHLLAWSLHELAASWDGGTARIAIVSTGPQPIPSVYWMSRSEAADHTLRHAQTFAASYPKAKSNFDQMATEMINPSTANRLMVSVAAGKENMLGDLDASVLTTLNERGNSKDAFAARRALAEAHAVAMYECVRDATGRDNPGDAGVVVVVDPSDPRAASTVHLINMGSDDSDDAPFLVWSPMPEAKAYFGKVRPRLAQWLNDPARPGTTRLICMAHGGETWATLQLAARAPSPVP